MLLTGWIASVAVLLALSTLVGAAPPARKRYDGDGEQQPSSTLPPPVLLIGAMKSGTSALYEAIVNHPQIHSAKALQGEPSWFSKEVHFFNHPSRFNRGLSFYEKHFDTIPADHVNVDGTPEYIYDFNVPGRVKMVYGTTGLKIVAVLRDPIDRAISHWRHAKVEGLWRQKRGETGHWTLATTRGFDSLDEKVLYLMKMYSRCAAQQAGSRTAELWRACIPRSYSDSLVAKGLYDPQIAVWANVFPVSSFCLISSDYFHNNATSALNVITDFLGVARHDWSELEIGEHSRREDGDVDISPPVREKMVAFYKRYGSAYYDLVKKYGYMGCGSDIPMEVLTI